MPLPQPGWQHRRADSPLGTLTLARSAHGLCGAWFDDQRDTPPASLFLPALARTDDPLLNLAADQLCAYFEGRLQRFDLPLDLSAGTGFQQVVWQALLGIGHGQQDSYGALAKRIGKPAAVRAVGSAIGRNPLSIIVPCHRVLGRDGQLTGYSGGLWRKEALLRLEGHAPPCKAGQ